MCFNKWRSPVLWPIWWKCSSTLCAVHVSPLKNDGSWHISKIVFYYSELYSGYNDRGGPNKRYIFPVKKETFGYLPHRPSTVLIQPLPLTKCLATSGTQQSVFSFEPKGFPTRRRKLGGRKVSISVSRVSHRQACARRDKHTKIFVHEAKPRRICTPDILQCASGSASFGPSLYTFYTKCDT